MAEISERTESQGQLIFGLDIGTRSIVGTVGYQKGAKFHVLAQRVKEHETRAMLDGQIHDIGKVAGTIAVVRDQLEEDLNCKLTDVCIAAAGRVLRTVTIHAEQAYESEKEITDEDIYTLDTLGVERAYEEFQNINETDMKFYCVGYTAMRYFMNGYQIGNLEGHKAKTIGVDLIATFLPDDVVGGLYKAVELAGLHVLNLTLEPIAAIQVAIPEKFRMLNMALVDVGAGTSDISITKDGTITAYGMIPVAGDSLTDILVQHCLVDFDTAEMIKRRAMTEEVVEYQDIMGLTQTIPSSEVKALLEDAVDNMTQMVAKTIRELNGEKPVSAVFVVGGGGLVDGYTEALAEELELPKDRVAIRGKEVMGSIVFELDNARMDAMMVTPIGICLSYYAQSNNFIFVEFNKSRMKLYDNGRLSVADAAMQVQFTNEDLFPKRGKALTFTVNGKSCMVRGSQGEPARITINGDPADLHTKIQSGDIVEIIPSTEGDPGFQELGKLSELGDPMHVTVNGSRITLPKTALVNGTQENEFYQIKEGDEVVVQGCYTVEQLAGFLDVPLGDDIRVNDAPARPDTGVYEGFVVSFDMTAASAASYEDLPDGEKADDKDLNAEEDGASSVKEAGRKAVSGEGAVSEKSITVTANDETVELTGKESFVFVDIFDYIHFDLTQSRGRGIVTLLNGANADYMAQLQDGDVIEIYWNEGRKET